MSFRTTICCLFISASRIRTAAKMWKGFVVNNGPHEVIPFVSTSANYAALAVCGRLLAGRKGPLSAR